MSNAISVTLEVCDPKLTDATAAHALIRRLVPHLRARRHVVVDFSRVDYVAPDFPQRAFGPLTAAFGTERMLECLRIDGAGDALVRSIVLAIRAASVPCAESGRLATTKSQFKP